MKYRRRVTEVDAEEVIEGNLPPGVGLCRGGELAIRCGEYWHDNPNYGDYIVYPDTKYDEDGELRYPEVWSKAAFERTFVKENE